VTGKSTKSEQEKTLSFDSTNYENILNLAEIHCRLDDSYAFQLLDRKLFNRANDYSGREYPTGSRRSNPHAWLDFRSFGQKTNAQVWDEIGGGASSADNALFVGALDRDGNRSRVEARGYKARAIQHEIDHLDGILFLDHLSAVKRGLLLSKWKKSRKGQTGYLKEVTPEPAGEL